VRFVDTNILLYAVSHAEDEQAKAAKANEILAARDLALSTQVLTEFYVQATRETRPDALSHEQAFALVEAFLRFPVLPVTAGLALRAMQSCAAFGISYWDAAIVEAARQLGCEQLLSEDLGDGRDYGGVHVLNPFARS